MFIYIFVNTGYEHKLFIVFFKYLLFSFKKKSPMHFDSTGLDCRLQYILFVLFLLL